MLYYFYLIGGVLLVMMKAFSILGLTSASLLSVIVTVPYIIAWWNFNMESREINLVNVKGINYVTYGEEGSLLNVTLISAYPKAAVERKSNIFVSQLFFLFSLNPNVTEFICAEIEVNFVSVDRTYMYFGIETLSFARGTLVNFYRKNDGGNIAPFSENISINVHPGQWPPFSQDLAHLFYFTDRIETQPFVRLSARLRTINREYSFITVFFDIPSHITAIYRFNYPPTIFIIYGCSMLVVAAITINLLYHRKTKQKQHQSVGSLVGYIPRIYSCN